MIEIIPRLQKWKYRWNINLPSEFYQRVNVRIQCSECEVGYVIFFNSFISMVLIISYNFLNILVKIFFSVGFLNLKICWQTNDKLKKYEQVAFINVQHAFKGPVHVSRGCLEILSIVWTRESAFSFCTGPWNLSN